MSNRSTPFWLGGEFNSKLDRNGRLSDVVLALGVAASMAACSTHPLDLTKVRMQTIALSLTGSSRPSILAIVRMTLAESGISSLYIGLSASLMRQMTYSLVRLGTYEEMKNRLARSGKASSGNLLFASALAGALGGIAGNPADILLVRMTTDALRPQESKYGYSNAFSGLLSLVESEGFRGLCRGMGTNTTRAILMNSSQVGSYDFIKSKLLRRQLPFSDYRFRDNLALHSVASCLAGTVATTICAPADVIKSRLMSASGKTKPLEILSNSLREEGPMFLFKGWTPAFIRLGPNTILMFVFLEQLKRRWAEWTSR